MQGSMTYIGRHKRSSCECSEHIPPSRRRTESGSTKVASSDQCRARRPVTNGRTIGAYRLPSPQSASYSKPVVLEDVDILGLQTLELALTESKIYLRFSPFWWMTLSADVGLKTVFVAQYIVGLTGQQTCQYQAGRPSDDGHGRDY